MSQQYIAQAAVTLNNLSNNELNDLLNDDDKLDERLKLLVSRNRYVQQAEEFLNKEPQLIELHLRVNGLKAKSTEIWLDIQQKIAVMKSKSSGMNHYAVLTLMETAAAECEEESDKIFKQFLDKELQVHGFLEQFMSSRKTMHVRKFIAGRI